MRAEVCADEKGQPVIHRAGYWPCGEASSPALPLSEGHRFTANWRKYRGTVAGASVVDGLDFMLLGTNMATLSDPESGIYPVFGPRNGGRGRKANED